MSSSVTEATTSDPPKRGLSPDECSEYRIECTCYAPKQLNAIYKAITGYKKCRMEVIKKDEFIRKQVVVVPTEPEPEISWWQEPQTIVAGIVLSASVSALLTVYLIKKD
jgi:hypothetical protein